MSREHHNTRHGHWADGKPTRTYRIWRCMINRCHYENDISYDRYGARGIKVCDRWRIFDNFLEDVGIIPAGLSLDRIDNHGDYEPSNVRLATAKQQQHNRRDNVTLTIKGVTKTLAEWADERGLARTTVHNRYRWGWSDEDCLKPPRSTQHVYLTVDGKTQTISEWSEETGLLKSTISRRRKWGWPDEKCISPSLRA